MKVDVNYEMVFNAIDNLKANKDLSQEEKKAVISVLELVQGDYIPTKEEFELQMANVERLKKIDYEKNPDAFERILKLTEEFENRYC